MPCAPRHSCRGLASRGGGRGRDDELHGGCRSRGMAMSISSVNYRGTCPVRPASPSGWMSSKILKGSEYSAASAAGRSRRQQERRRVGGGAADQRRLPSCGADRPMRVLSNTPGSLCRQPEPGVPASRAAIRPSRGLAALQTDLSVPQLIQSDVSYQPQETLRASRGATAVPAVGEPWGAANDGV